ncbi:post-transcriptional regulator [Mesobacillus harenae]|uniref:post-transcriptional regulator n=1 Tax=Mesobacillus harenae TaxID=2213203 RepID=UPI001580EFE1|nr:post-transcriptional regulator [Mesobacillus harenae]
MIKSHQYDAYRQMVQPAIDSKLEEFKMLGYGTVTEGEFWNFLMKKKWKKPKDDIQLYEVVADILSVRVSTYMNFATVEAFKLEDFNLDDEKDRRELLK